MAPVSRNLPLNIKLYYHAGIQPDTEFLQATCIAIGQFPQVAVSVFVGDSVTKDEKGAVWCLDSNNQKTSDCLQNIQHACASKLVDPNIWTCCRVSGGDDVHNDDSCARYMFQQDPIKVVTALLAPK